MKKLPISKKFESIRNDEHYEMLKSNLAILVKHSNLELVEGEDIPSTLVTVSSDEPNFLLIKPYNTLHGLELYSQGKDGEIKRVTFRSVDKPIHFDVSIEDCNYIIHYGKY